MKKLISVFVLLGTMAVPFAGPYDTWAKFREITVNTTATGGGAGVATAQNNFPVLVRLKSDSAAVGADVLTGSLTAGGLDVQFTDSTGTVALNFEKERWTSTAAEFWVKVPAVAGNATTKIRMYWGKAAQASASSGAAVFDTANDWRAVWHMTADSTTIERDATVHGLTMTASETAPTDTVGAIGRARTFAGVPGAAATRQYFVAAGTASHAATDNSTNNPHTVSAWVYARGISATNSHGNSIFNKGDHQYCLQVYGATGATVKRWESAVYTSTWRQIQSRSATPAAVGAWYHVTGTWSGGANGTNGTGQMYVNGVLDSSVATLGIGTTNPTRTFNVFIGANPSSGTPATTAPGTPTSLTTGTSTNPRFWNGHIDEVTLARGVRSADWIKLTYETQKSTATAVTLGTAQTPTPTSDAEVYSSWGQRKTWYLHTRANGANVANNVVKFPVLIRLDSANFNAGFTQTLAGGADLRFTKANDATRLPHQIEHWDAAGKRASVWVLVDTVKGNTNNQVLRMHWQKAGAADSSDGRAVFDTANGFAAVFHLNEAAGDTIRDATANRFKGVPVKTAPANVAASGAISGTAKSFGGAATDDSTGGAYRLLTAAGGSTANSFDYVAATTGATISAWANITAFGTGTANRKGIVSKSMGGTGTAATAQQWYLRAISASTANAAPENGRFHAAGSWGSPSTPAVERLGANNIWTYLAYIRPAADMHALRVYSAAAAAAATEATNTNAVHQNVSVFIGSFAGDTVATATGAGFFPGAIDEVRIENVARSADWHDLSYANQRAGQNLVSADTLTTTGVLAGFRVAGVSFTAKPFGTGLMFQIGGTAAAAARLTLVDMRGNAVWSANADLRGGRPVFWNADKAASGLYALHIRLMDADGKVTQTLNRTIPFTR